MIEGGVQCVTCCPAAVAVAAAAAVDLQGDGEDGPVLEGG